MDEPAMLRVVPIDHRDQGVAASLVVLQRASYRVEAELIGTDAIPPLHESASAVAALELTYLAIEDDGELVGAVGHSVANGVLDIDRLMVHPTRFREGLASRLVGAVLDRVPHERAIVSTGQRNHPARRLYERAGFVHDADFNVTPPLVVSRYERPIPSTGSSSATSP